tara:strand:- start:74 stop:1408 length:1335 start_codon:yes stop_codon:yes gene_type:complete
MDERNKFSKRVKRYANLGSSAGMIALKFASTKLLKNKNLKNAETLSNMLGGLKGPVMKIAQLLSTVPDLLPPEYTQALSKLQSNAPPMGWNFVRRRMRAELGSLWQSKFKEFSKEPTAAASLGQVHLATIGQENKVACKLQYPDMESIVEADINQLRIAFKLYKQIDASIETKNILQEISERVREELDYNREKKNLNLYSNLFKKTDEVSVPRVYEYFSTKKLLTMSWLDGKKILHFKDHSHAVRKKIALNMFKAWYIPFYKAGIIHGDPHLGNYSIRKDLGINLLDFGCIRVFKPSFVKGVIDLYFAILENNDDLAVSAYETWGFKNINKELISILNIWAKFLYSPLLEDKIRKMQDTNSTAYGAQAASKVHRELKKIGGVTPPREFVFMDRAAIGLGSVFLHLNAEINWYRVFHSLIENFSIKTVENFQKSELKKANISIKF